MRWKLLLVTSLLSAVAGAGASLAIIYALLGSTIARILSPDIPTAATALLMPAGFITFAAIFVYRHTSRRRALQAITTVLFAVVMTAAAFAAASALLSKRLPQSLISPDSDKSNA